MVVLFSGADPLWQFGKRSSKKHFCEIVLKSPYWPWKRCCLTVFLLFFLFCFFIFCSGGHFVQQSITILAILVEGHPRNISVKLF